jgi:hypothetical protein
MSAPTRPLVKRSQKMSISPAASQQWSGTGRPVRKDSSRLCLHEHSARIDSQHMPRSWSGSEEKGSTTASERRGAAETAMAT